MNSFSQDNQRNKSGSIIIFVLALVALMSVILTKFLQVTVEDIKKKNLLNMESSLKDEAYSMLHLSLAVISEYKEAEGQLYHPYEGWGSPLNYTEFETRDSVRIILNDETGKMPLETGNVGAWEILFENLAVGFSERQTLANSLLDWMDEDDLERINGAEKDYYESQEVVVSPPNQKIKSYNELYNIRGFQEVIEENPEFYSRFKSSVSLYNENSININTATETTIETLAQRNNLDPVSVLLFLNGEDGIRFTEDDQWFESLSDPLLSGFSKIKAPTITLNPTIFRITIEVNRGDNGFLLNCVCQFSESEGNNSKNSYQQIGKFEIIKISENTTQ